MILRQKMQNWEQKSVFTEKRLSKNKIWYAADNHTYMCHIIWAKEFLDLNFNETVIDKILNFHKI